MANEKVLIGVKLDYESELNALISDIKSLENKNLKIPIKLDADISKEIKEITNQIKSMSSSLNSAFNFAPAKKMDSVFASISSRIKQITTASGTLAPGKEYQKLLKAVSYYKSIGGDINKLYGVTDKRNVGAIMRDMDADKDLKKYSANILDTYNTINSLKPLNLEDLFTGKLDLNQIRVMGEELHGIAEILRTSLTEIQKQTATGTGTGLSFIDTDKMKAGMADIAAFRGEIERLEQAAKGIGKISSALNALGNVNFTDLKIPPEFMSSLETLNTAIPDASKSESLRVLANSLGKLDGSLFSNLQNFKLSPDFHTMIQELGNLSSVTEELKALGEASKYLNSAGGNFISMENYDKNNAKWISDWESKYINKKNADGTPFYAATGQTEIERTTKGIVRLTTVVQGADGAYKKLIGTVSAAGEVMQTATKKAKVSDLAGMYNKDSEKELANYYKKAIANAQKYATILAKQNQNLPTNKKENDFVAEMKQTISEISAFEKQVGADVMSNLSTGVAKLRSEYLSSVVDVQGSSNFTKFTAQFENQKQVIDSLNAQYVELINNLSKVKGAQESGAIEKVEEEYAKLMDRFANGKIGNTYDLMKGFGKFYNKFNNVAGFYTGENDNVAKEAELKKYIQQRAGFADVEFTKTTDPMSGDVVKVTGKYLDRTIGQYKTLTATIEKSTNAIRVSQTASTKYVSGFQQAIDSLGSKLKSVGRYLMAYVTLQDLWRFFKQGVSAVKEFDTALTEMRKVSDESLTSLKSFQKESFSLADNVGTTALQIQKSTADFMRLGNTLTEASQNAQTANVLFNVSEFETIDEATSSLISMEAAYRNLSGTEIIDKLNHIGNSYAVSTEGISQALQRAGSALTTAGNDIDESTAMIAAANTVVQDPEKVGNGLRTIALRLTGTKAAAESLQEMGEETEGMIQTESKLRQTIMDATKTAKNTKGFDIMTDSGQYKSTYEILQGIADIWEDIGEMDKATGNTNQNLLLETMAGKNRANILAAILQSPDILQSAYIDSQNSEGSAQEELDKYLESIEGKMQKFRNATQELASDLLSSDLIKFFVDFGTAGVHALDGLAKHINIVTVALGALTAIGAKKMGNPLLTLERGENGFKFKSFVDRFQESATIESDDEDIAKFFEEQKAIQKYENEQKRQMKLMAKARAKSGEAETPNRRLKSSASTLKSTNYTDAEMDFIKQLQAERERMGEFLKSVGHKSDAIAAANDKVLRDRLTKFQEEQAAQGRKVDTAKIREAVESNEQPKIRTIKGTKSGKKLDTDTTNLLKSGKQFKSIEGSVDSLSAKMGTLTERYAKWKGETQKSIPIMEGFTKALETEPGKYSNDFKGMLSYIRQSGIGLQAMKTTLIGIGSQIVSMMASMAVAMVAAVALQKVIEGLEYIVHYSDHMIENGQEARNTVDEINDSINNTRSTIQSLGKTKITDTTQEDEKNVKNLGTSIDQIAKKYTDLKRGVGSDNENLFLSEDEYSEFIDISNKLAEAIPELKYGTDSSGNAILALGDNAAESAEKIRELYDETQKLNAADIEKNFGAGIKGLKYEMQDLEKKYGKYSAVGSEFSWENMFANGDEVVEHFRERMEMAKQAESAIEEYSDVFQKTGMSSQHNTDWALQAGDQSGQIMEGASITGENLVTSAEALKDNIKNGLDEAERYNAETRQLLSEFSSYTSQFLSSREVFGELDYDLQNTITKSFAVNKGYFADLFAEVDYDETKYKSALYERFIDPLETISSDIEKQQSLKDLLEQKVGDMTPEQFKKNYQSQLQNIFGDAYTENLDKMFGFDERYNQYQKYIDAIRDEFKREGTEALRSEDVKKILGMSTGDLEIAYKILLDSDDAIKSFDILQQKIDETKENTVEATSYLNDYVASQGKANTANYTKVAEATAAEATNMARGIRNEDYSRLIGGFDKTTTPTISAPALIPNYEELSSAVTAYSKAYSGVIKQALSSPEVKSAIESGTDLADIKLKIDSDVAEQFQAAYQNIQPFFEELNLSQEQFNEFVAQGSANVYSLFETFDTQQRAMEYFTDDGLGVYSFMKDVIDATKESKELDGVFVDIGKDGRVSFKKNEKFVKALSQKLNISTEAAGYLLDAAKDIGAVDIGTIYAQAGKNSLSGFLSDLQAVSAAMSEISQNGYLTYDTMTNLVSANGAYADALVNTASGMIVNNEEMQALNEQAAEYATADIQDSVNQLTDEFVKNSNTLADYVNKGGNVKKVLNDIAKANGDVEVAAKSAGASVEEYTKIWQAYNANESIGNTIIDLQRQQSEIRANVSLMQEYKNALQTPNMNANFLTTVGGKEGADKLYEQGWWGTDDFATYAKLIGQNGWDDKTAILSYEESLQRVGKYLTEDASGVHTFWNDAIALGDKFGVTLDDNEGYILTGINNMEEFADAMGVTTEFAENMVLALHDAGQRDIDLSMISDGIRNDLSQLGTSILNDEKTFKNAINMTERMGDNAESALDKIVIARKAVDQALSGKDMQATYDLFNQTFENAQIDSSGKIQVTTELISQSIDGLKEHIKSYREETDKASKTDMYKNIQEEMRSLSYLDIPTLNEALDLNIDKNATREEVVQALAEVADMTDTEKLSLKLGIEVPEDTTAEVQRQLSDLQDAMDDLNELKLKPDVSTEELDGAMDRVLRIAETLDAESRQKFLAHFGIEVDENGVIQAEQTKANLGQPVQTMATVYVPQDTLTKLTALQTIVNDVGKEHDGEIVIEGSEDAQEEVEALASELADLPQEKLIEYGFTPGKTGNITADDIKRQIGDINLTANFKALPTTGNDQTVTVKVNGAAEGAKDVDTLNESLGRLAQRGAVSVSVDTGTALFAIAGLQNTLNTLQSTVVQPTVSMALAGFYSDATVVNATLNGISKQIAQPTVSMQYGAFRGGASDVRAQMAGLNGLSAYPSVSLSGGSYVLYQLNNIRSDLNSLDGKTARTYVETVKTTKYGNPVRASGTVHANASGTANAYAGGTPNNTDVAIKNNETALVNELGYESIVFSCNFIQ